MANYTEILEVLRLPHSTADCSHSPDIQFSLGLAKLTYDYESADGASYAHLIFTGAVAIRFTPDSAVTEQMVQAYSRICEWRQSKWLGSLADHALQQGTPLSDELRHFCIYFDHYGCVDVVAKEFELSLAEA